jgi:Methionine synthase I, cobalamin-binding domain
MEIDNSEVLRYMGVRSGGEEFYPLIEEISGRLLKELKPARIFGRFPVEKRGDEVIIKGAGVIFKGKLVSARLKNSGEIALIAATLGLKSESVLEGYKGDISRYVVADACMTALIESVADGAEAEIKSAAEKAGEKITARFSPGYGDFDISSQKDVLSLLNAQKNIGLFMKESYMLVPNKSVTAVIGIGREPCPDKKKSCEDCELNDYCIYKSVTKVTKT